MLNWCNTQNLYKFQTVSKELTDVSHFIIISQ
nr:MAG TPA: hypothetical protein [Caudoviricetes sp.]